MATATIPAPAEMRDAFVQRMLDSATATFDIFSIYLGDKLGYYQALAEAGPQTAATLAARTSTSERYTREWLEHQAAGRILDYLPDGRFALPPGHDEVLADRESLNFFAPIAQLIAGCVRPLDLIVEAYRTGRGVPFQAYGDEGRQGQGRINRTMFLHQLRDEWFPAIAELHGRLGSAPSRVADVGCGVGWSSIGIAQAYPQARVVGLDLDGPSIDDARAHASQAGVTDRVQFEQRDAADPGLREQFDLVCAFECLHDMSDPVGALRAMRGLARPGAFVLIVDERVSDKFTGEATPIERLLYGFSLFHCLPAGMAEQPSACTGTVMRVSTLKEYAREAGFRDVEILPVDHFQFRFYRLIA